MNPEELYRLLHQKPFQSFRVCLKNGRAYDIRHPRLAVVGKTYFSIGIPLPNHADPVYDFVVTVDLSDIDRVDWLNQKETTLAH